VYASTRTFLTGIKACKRKNASIISRDIKNQFQSCEALLIAGQKKFEIYENEGCGCLIA
jgi:hypothetical protein